MVEQAVEHGGDGGAVAEQFSPVFHRAVGSQQGAGAFVATHDVDLKIPIRPHD